PGRRWHQHRLARGDPAPQRRTGQVHSKVARGALALSAARTRRHAALHGTRKALEHLLQLRIARDVRRREQDDVALDAIDVDTGGVADEAVLERALADGLGERELRRKWRTRRPVGNELDADEESASADVAHRLVARESLAHGGLKLRPGGAHALEQV